MLVLTRALVCISRELYAPTRPYTYTVPDLARRGSSQKQCAHQHAVYIDLCMTDIDSVFSQLMY